MLPLSLWHVSPLIPGIITGVVIVVQIFLTPSILSAFYLKPLKLEDEDKKRLEELEEKVKKIVVSEKLDPAGFRLLVFPDEVPICLSIGGIFSGGQMAVSTGLSELLNDEEFETIIKRELKLLGMTDTGFFTVTSFLPFLLYGAASWMFESARLSRVNRGSGASFLMGKILHAVGRASEFLILPIARKRHKLADDYVKEMGRAKELSTALKKAGERFIIPVKEGVSFRKRIYEGMRSLLPFDPLRRARLKMWKSFIGPEAESFKPVVIGEILEKFNYHIRMGWLTSPHPPVRERYADNENGDSEEIKKLEETLREISGTTKADFYLGLAPFILFCIGALLSVILKGYFGLPLILTALGTYAGLYHRLKKEKKAEAGRFAADSKIEINGSLKGFMIDDEIDFQSFYIVTKERILPLILKQYSRNDDPLLFLQGDDVKVEGVVESGEIPYIDLRTLITKGKKPTRLKSFHTTLRFMAATAILAAGVLITVIKYAF